MLFRKSMDDLVGRSISYLQYVERDQKQQHQYQGGDDDYNKRAIYGDNEWYITTANSNSNSNSNNNQNKNRNTEY